MIQYLARALRRQFRESRTLFLLTLLGVAVGVASVVSIQVLNQGALLAFEGSMQAVSGQADLSILGTTPTLDETLYRKVLEDPAVTAAWPLVRVDVAVAGRKDMFLDVVGFDIFAPVRYPLTAMDVTEDSADLVTQAITVPGWIAVTPGLAASEGWSVGDTLTVSSGSRLAVLTIGALVDFQKYEPMAPSRLAVMDIAQAQGMLARSGRIHQIDLTLAEGTDISAATSRLQKTLGPGVRVLSPEQRRQDTRGLLAAFRLNLTALSLISIFVALFLVLTSIQASLVRRRGEFGLLRSLGSTRGQVMVLVVAEAGALGLLGVLVGIPLGYLIALMNIDTVSATLTSIYVIDGLEKMTLPVEVVLLGIAVGLLGAMGAAVLPAIDISRRDTVALMSPVALHRRTGKWAGRLALLALATALIATTWFALHGAGLRHGGFIYGFLMMVSLPLIVPMVVCTVCRPARPRGIGPALSLRNLVVRLQTTSFAVAALAVTVSMLVGITLLVGSFRQTLVTWLDTTIRADVYLSTESWVRAGNEAFLDEPLLEDLADLAGVRAVETQRRLQVRTTDGDHLIWLNGVTMAGIAGAELAERLPLMAGDPVQVSRRLQEDGAVMIGEPLARKAGLAVGDTLRLAGPRGPVYLPVAGIAYDYTSEGGTAFLVGEFFTSHFGPGPPNNAALFIDPDLPVDSFVASLKTRYAGRPLVFRSNRILRAEVMDIFDQTFAVTRTLQSMALLIAVCGVSLTLLIQARERSGELALLRALGATRRQVFGLFLGEGVGMGVLGIVLGTGGGIGLAALLILVINREWFGWTIQPSIDVPAILQQMAVILSASALAAVYPAFKAGLSSPQQLVRDDL
jgi:putative ABC transport system permease protein